MHCKRGKVLWTMELSRQRRKRGEWWQRQYYVFTNSCFITPCMWGGNLFPVFPANWILADEMWTGSVTCPFQTYPLKPPTEITMHMLLVGNQDTLWDCEDTQWKEPGSLLEWSLNFQSSTTLDCEVSKKKIFVSHWFLKLFVTAFFIS